MSREIRAQNKTKASQSDIENCLMILKHLKTAEREEIYEGLTPFSTVLYLLSIISST